MASGITPFDPGPRTEERLRASFRVARPAASADVVVYSNDFTAGAGSEWSNNSTAVSNGEHFFATERQRFRGRYRHADPDRPLADYQVTVSFDLDIIQSMDGNGPKGGGPEVYRSPPMRLPPPEHLCRLHRREHPVLLGVHPQWPGLQQLAAFGRFRCRPPGLWHR